MSDSRVTLPVETFALLLRTQITRFNSESDDRLVDICASENPQCRLTRKDGYVSLENLSSIFSPKTDRRGRYTAAPSEPADFFPAPEFAAVHSQEAEAHGNGIIESELKKLLSILSAEADHRAEHPTLPSAHAVSLATPEIAPHRVPEDGIPRNEMIESELKNLLSIISSEANHRAEPGMPSSESVGTVPVPETTAELVQGDEIRAGREFEDDEKPPRASRLKPILGGVGVVAIVLLLIGYAIDSSRQAQHEIPAGIPVQNANSAADTAAASPGSLAGPDSQAAAVAQIKAPFGTWIDPATGLMWTLKDNRVDVNWQQAAQYCRDLRLAGHDDWRLPMIDELQGIYDARSNVSGHCCGGTQVAMQVKGSLSLSGWEWSSAQKGPYGTPFSFYNGGRYTNLLSASDGGRALCVRTLGQLIAQPTSGAQE